MGVELTDLETALQFNLFHEGLHAGAIQALLRAVGVPIDRAMKRGWGRVEIPACRRGGQLRQGLNARDTAPCFRRK